MTAPALPYASRRADGDRIPRRAGVVAYAAESYRRDDDKTFGAPEVRFTSTARACAYLDRLAVPGDVEVWVERTQRREFVARRRADGVWLHREVDGRFFTAAGVEVLPNAPEFSLWSCAQVTR